MQEQTWDDRLEDIVIRMQTRQAQVKNIVRHYASEQVLRNSALNNPGTFAPLPGANLVTLVATILSQGPTLFQPMAEDIARIYQVAPDNRFFTPSPDNAGTINDSLRAFSQHLLRQVVKRLLLHYFSALTIERTTNKSLIPDGIIYTIIAVQVTNWMGVMLTAYFENGQQWIGGSPVKTTDVLRYYGDGDTSIDDISFIPEVSEGIITRLVMQSRTIYEEAGTETFQEMHQVLANILRLKLLRASFSFPE